MNQPEEWQKEEVNIKMEQPMEPIDGQPNTMVKRKNKKRLILNPKQSTGHWSEVEHKTYLDFLQAHRPIMESQDQKKTSKIFKLMSEIISTRSPSQCRSHHQKFNPFIHQIKKRQKGAGRKRKEQSQNDKSDFQKGQLDNQYLGQFLFQQPTFYPPYDYNMMGFQLPYNQYMNYQVPEGQEDKGQMDQMLYAQYMFQQQLSQLDDKNLPYNFSFIQQPQVHLNINYYPQQDPYQDKEGQYDEQ